jgi:hypothetical protein
MNNRTLSEILHQIQAMNCSEYKIGIFNGKDKKMINRDFLDHNSIFKLVPWLAYQNYSGKDIYITQASNLDRALILVDDVSDFQINEMARRGVAPACVVETSPHNFQVWVSLGSEPMSKPERKIAATLLAKEFKGDMASVDANHYGRLAGFTNRKEKHLTSVGYPFVLCRDANGRAADKSHAVREWVKKKYLYENKESGQISFVEVNNSNAFKSRMNPMEAFKKYFAEWSWHTKLKGNALDNSRGDFAVVCRMLKEGYSKELVILALIENSPDIQNRKLNHIDDYAIRTVNAAFKAIQS